MDTHWHAYVYLGHTRPTDAEARDPQSSTPPHVLDLWFHKPRTMLAATFTDPAQAAHWLERELSRHPPPPAALPLEAHLAHARDALGRRADAYVGYWTATGRFLVHTLLTCPRPGLPCPDPPATGARPEPRTRPTGDADRNRSLPWGTSHRRPLG